MPWKVTPPKAVTGLHQKQTLCWTGRNCSISGMTWPCLPANAHLYLSQAHTIVHAQLVTGSQVQPCHYSVTLLLLTKQVVHNCKSACKACVENASTVLAQFEQHKQHFLVMLVLLLVLLSGLAYSDTCLPFMLMSEGSLCAHVSASCQPRLRCPSAC